MQIDRMDLFPVPVLGAEFDNGEELRKTLVPIIHDIEKADSNPQPYSAEGYTNYDPGQQIIEHPALEELREFIGKTGLEANKILGLKNDLMFTGSWFSIGRQYSTHFPHNHIPSTWSGVYYVQAEEDDATLTFIDRNKESNWPWAHNIEMNNYSTPQFSIKPKTSRLIMFPAHMQHMVGEQRINRERITISFNMSITMDMIDENSLD